MGHLPVVLLKQRQARHQRIPPPALGAEALISGMAVGFDSVAASGVLRLRAAGLPVRLMAALPDVWQPLTYDWLQGGQRHWTERLRAADVVWLAGTEPEGTARARQVAAAELLEDVRQARDAGQCSVPDLADYARSRRWCAQAHGTLPAHPASTAFRGNYREGVDTGAGKGTYDYPRREVGHARA